MFDGWWSTLLSVVLLLKDGESGTTLFEIHISVHRLLVLVRGKDEGSGCGLINLRLWLKSFKGKVNVLILDLVAHGIPQGNRLA